MTADPVAVLVVPTQGDPGGLLKRGRFGVASPAAVTVCPGCGVWEHVGCAYPPPVLVIAALPLWWDGALVPEGWDRAQRVMRARVRADGYPMTDPWQESPDWFFVAEYARFLVTADLASRVVLLDRVDGRLVERAP